MNQLLPFQPTWHCVKSVRIRSYFSPNTGKYRLEITPYLDTFHTVWELQKYYAISDQFQKGKQIKRYLRLQDQSPQNSFQQTILRYRMRQTKRPGRKQRRYSRFTFVENAIKNLPEVSRAKFLGNDRLFCFISTYASLTASRTLLER